MGLLRWAQLPFAGVSGRRDRSGALWIHVPGHDYVQWDEQTLTRHAEMIAGEHVPDRYARTVRVLGVPVFVVVRLMCRNCRVDWACREGAWAHLWLRGARPSV